MITPEQERLLEEMSGGPVLFLNDWVTCEKAADIISHNSGGNVPQDYVRRLVVNGRLPKISLSSRVVLYSRKAAEQIVVRKHKKKQAAVKK